MLACPQCGTDMLRDWTGRGWRRYCSKPCARKGYTGSSRTPKAQGHPTTIDIAWAAGIYEGEGTCGPGQCSVVQKDPWILERFVYLFGGTLSVRISGVARNHIWGWRATGSRHRGFLMTIYGFLSPRRRVQVRQSLLHA